MPFTYTGSLANNMRLALVDDTENNGVPCFKSQAGNAAVVQAGAANKVVNTFDTSTLDASKVFALCYCEGDGTASDATWADSGLRLTVSKVHSVQVESGYVGVPDKLITSAPSSTNRLPSLAQQTVRYLGSLPNGKYFSLVALSLNSNNPCVDPTVATALATSAGSVDARLHSGVMKGSTDGNYASPPGDLITIPQTAGNLLVPSSTVFTLCIAEGDGSVADKTWSDSYIRVKMSGIVTLTMTIASRTIVHRTEGQIPAQAGGVP